MSLLAGSRGFVGARMDPLANSMPMLHRVKHEIYYICLKRHRETSLIVPNNTIYEHGLSSLFSLPHITLLQACKDTVG